MVKFCNHNNKFKIFLDVIMLYMINKNNLLKFELLKTIHLSTGSMPIPFALKDYWTFSFIMSHYLCKDAIDLIHSANIYCTASGEESILVFILHTPRFLVIYIITMITFVHISIFCILKHIFLKLSILDYVQSASNLINHVYQQNN